MIFLDCHCHHHTLPTSYFAPNMWQVFTSTIEFSLWQRRLGNDGMGPLLSTWINFIPAWVSNHTPSKEQDEIIYPFSNFNGWLTVEVWEWMHNFITHIAMDVITYPCWGESLSLLVKGSPGRFAAFDTYPNIVILSYEIQQFVSVFDSLHTTKANFRHTEMNNIMETWQWSCKFFYNIRTLLMM